MSAQGQLLVGLFLSALAAGAVNSVAGGGTLLTFPVLLAALSPALGVEKASVAANATSTVALVSGSLAGAWGYRHEMRAVAHWTRLLIVPSLVGGAVGALLVILLDPRIFHALVPWLILVAALLFLVQPLVGRLVPANPQPTRLSAGGLAVVLLFQLAVAIYGGYFGAGIGILMLSSLGLMGLPGVHQMNAVKTFLAFCINSISILVFAALNQVVWSYALLMAGAAIVGGYLGARLARRVKPVLVRWLIILVGFGLAGHFFYKEWKGEAPHSEPLPAQSWRMAPSLGGKG